MSKKMKIKILKPLKDHEKGKIISINVDGSGIPLERYWRNRISDSKIDKCIEIIKDKVDNKKKQNNSVTGSKLK